MALSAGTRLGPYEIVDALGAGGMGEVYKARDTRLDRTVAVKILPSALATDPQFRERFDREARIISQLAHPHICRLYDVGSQNEVDFLVLEYLEGQELSARLEKGPLAVEQGLAIAIQIAAALDAAHRTGVVHRDLKPGNVMLTKAAAGSASLPHAKLLDFGLAKTTGPVVTTSGLSMAPTTPPATITAAGTILGTFHYMSPEQIEGMEADARTDIFAFGCVLYEMLTGRKAFEGKTRASLLGAILKDDPPPLSQVQPNVPSALDHVVATCLAKDPDDRWQNARDVMRELQWVANSTRTAAIDGGNDRPARGRSVLLWMIGIAAASAAIAGAVVWLLMRPATAARPVVRLQAPPPLTTSLNLGTPSPDLALSPDGTHLVFSAGSEGLLYLRALDETEASALSGITNARGPFFSPDGEWIGYFQGSELKKVSVHGGTPVTICTGCAQGNRGATWGTDDTIVFSPAGGTAGLKRISASGGDPIALTTLDASKGEQGHMLPEFLPGDRAILFTITTGGAVENALIAVRDLTTGTQTILIRGGSQPRYVPPGYLVYAVSGSLRVVRFDLPRLATIGNPMPSLEHVVMKAVGAADFSVSRDGSLAYISGDVQAPGSRLTWIDRQGHEEPIPAPPRNYVYPRLSPDGQRLALDIRDQQFDIWIWDFSRGVLNPLTNHPSADQNPVWTPDGRRVAYASTRTGTPNVYWQLADGTGAAERVTTSDQIQYPLAFTPDGKTLVLRNTDPKTGSDVSVMSLEGDRTVKPLIHTPFAEMNADLSPDGRWIAYQSNESGRDDIHVRPFPAVDSGHWLVSPAGGSRPLWSRSGQELFYVDLRSRLMTVPVQPGAMFVAGNPSMVVELAGGSGIGSVGGPGRYYDVSPDGRRFLVIRDAGRTSQNAAPPQLNVVLNWSEEVKRLFAQKP